MEIKKITAHSFVGDYGQMIDEVRIETEGLEGSRDLSPEDFVCTNCFGDIGASKETSGVTEVCCLENELILKTEPFLYRCDFSIALDKGDISLTVSKQTIGEVEVYHSELFRAVKEDGLVYRIYEPDSSAPRPLILFLHGGGGSGDDNMLELTDTLGAIKLAERVPDMYVLAPQAPAGALSMEEAFAKMMAKGNPFQVILRTDPDNDPEDRGWNRAYLGRVCDLIRRMIAEGRVDPARVYCIGMSMGGFGTIKTVAAAPDLFAACVPICPSMNGESYPILENFPDVPAYIATSYIDHQTARHAYILRAVQKLWEKGRRDIRFTIFTPEELAEYGIGVGENLSMKELFAQNHNSWIPVLHNEYGILDWMFSHRNPHAQQR